MLLEFCTFFKFVILTIVLFVCSGSRVRTIWESLQNNVIEALIGWPRSRIKNFPEFFRLFQSRNYTFPEAIATKILAIWQHLGRFLAIFSLCMHRNGYFSWHLLGRVATAWDHSDPVYPVNSCFMRIFNHTKTILFVIIFPWGCTEFPENSLSFPCSEKSPSIPGFPGVWPPWLTLSASNYCVLHEASRQLFVDTTITSIYVRYPLQGVKCNNHCSLTILRHQ